MDDEFTEALSRTLLLMRNDLQPKVRDQELLEALTGTRVALTADPATLATHSGQCAFISAALMMARSGHEVYLCASDALLVGYQPPLTGSHLRPGMMAAGLDLLPGRSFRWGTPDGPVDLSVALGVASGVVRAEISVSINATDWSASLERSDDGKPWGAGEWPMGAFGAAAIAAGEAFKVAMRRLRTHARAPAFFDKLYAPASACSVELAPRGARVSVNLPDSDMISAGAIANAALYVLLRLPGVTGRMRAFDDDMSGLSNLNRNMLLLHSHLALHKVRDLAAYSGGLHIEPVPYRYDAELAKAYSLRDFVLVGADHIPTRWVVQRAKPRWLGVGATDQFMAMSSYHQADLPCAGCLHPQASEEQGPIPTVAFVSFWSGLLLATQFLRGHEGEPGDGGSQQVIAYPLHPETNYGGHVTANGDCPVSCEASRSVLLDPDGHKHVAAG